MQSGRKLVEISARACKCSWRARSWRGRRLGAPWEPRARARPPGRQVAAAAPWSRRCSGRRRSSSTAARSLRRKPPPRRLARALPPGVGDVRSGQPSAPPRRGRTFGAAPVVEHGRVVPQQPDLVSVALQPGVRADRIARQASRRRRPQASTYFAAVRQPVADLERGIASACASAIAPAIPTSPHNLDDQSPSRRRYPRGARSRLASRPNARMQSVTSYAMSNSCFTSEWEQRGERRQTRRERCKKPVACRARSRARRSRPTARP